MIAALAKGCGGKKAGWRADERRSRRRRDDKKDDGREHRRYDSENRRRSDGRSGERSGAITKDGAMTIKVAQRRMKRCGAINFIISPSCTRISSANQILSLNS